MHKIKLRLLSFLLLLVVCAPSFGQSKLVQKVEKKPGELVIPYEKWVLPNGLTVIIHEDHSDPIVHVEVTYHVGSAREHIGITGFAHFFEHMMFQGSKNVADEEHIKIVESAGGQMNGTTSDDRTNYFETVPSNMLETALWLEADRMGYLIPAVTPQKFEVQRSAVKNEKAQNIVNRPYVLAMTEKSSELLYPKNHPYSWSTIGYVDDLDRVTVEDLKRFFLRWYGPNNAILVVSGDVNPAEVLKMAEKYFGPIPRGQEVKKQRVEQVQLSVDVFGVVEDNIYAPLTSMVFPTVANYNRDEAALDILAEILGGNKNSIFYQSMVKNEFALQAEVSHPCRELAGEFQIQVVTDPRRTRQQTLDTIKAVLNRFDVNTISDDELLRAKAKFESQLTSTLESIQGKGSTLTQWEMLLDKPYNLQDELTRYKSVTKQDLIRVYNKYIKNKPSATIYVTPRNPNDARKLESFNPHAGEVNQEAEKQYDGLTYTEPKDNFDRSVRPAIPAAKPAVVPVFTTNSFDNGLKIIHTRHNEVPKVTLYLRIPGGHLLEAYDPKTIGLASFTADMMNEGTQNFTSEAIDGELDKLGSSITFSGGGQSTNVYVTSLVKNVDATLKLLEEILLRPGFKEEDFKRLKAQIEEGLNVADKNPSALAGKAFAKLVYGDNILGTATNGYTSTVSKITLQDVKNFYNSYYTPTGATLTIVGDVDMSELLPKLGFLKTWARKEVKLPEITNFPAVEKTGIYLVNVPGATQSVIIMGKLGMPFDYKGDFYKTNVANYTFGGSFNSRINLNLREEKGYTYGIYAGLTGSALPGYFGISSSVKVNATDSAVTEIIKEMKKWKESGITPEELATTKNSINQSDALKYETSYDKANFLSTILLYNLPSTYISEQNQVLNALTKTDIDAIAKSFYDADKMIIVIAGDVSDIRKPLEKLNIGKIEVIDANKIKVAPVKK